jgi:hypothetical protein
MRIISLDPGGTTGYVVWDSSHEGVLYFAGSWGQLGPDPHHEKLWRLLLEQDTYMSGNLLIICERFDNRGNDFAKLVSVEYIGVVKLYQQVVQHANVCSGQGVVWQGSDVKTWADNKKLKACGMLLTPMTKWRHANDAMRHLLYYVCHSSDLQLQDAARRYFQMLKANL